MAPSLDQWLLHRFRPPKFRHVELGDPLELFIRRWIPIITERKYGAGVATGGKKPRARLSTPSGGWKPHSGSAWARCLARILDGLRKLLSLYEKYELEKEFLLRGRAQKRPTRHIPPKCRGPFKSSRKPEHQQHPARL